MITFEEKKALSEKLKSLKGNVENIINNFDNQCSPSRWLWREYMMFMNDILFHYKLENQKDKEHLCAIIDLLELESFYVTASNDFITEKKRLIDHIDRLLKKLI